MLHGNAAAGGEEVVEGVRFSMDREEIEWLMANNAGPIKYFAGYSGWGQGQLQAEIDEGAWRSLYSTTSRPFDPPSTGKIAVKVKLAGLPQVLPAILVGLTERSTLVTLRGTDVGMGVLPPVPAVLQADNVKKRKQKDRSAEQREPPLMGDHRLLCTGCCNIVFSPEKL